MSERKPVAYGELWERKAEHAIEISHLIVDRFQRSEGVGTKMLNLLFARASSKPDVEKVLLNLYSDSPEILGCYVKAGFELIGTATHVEGLKMQKIVTAR